MRVALGGFKSCERPIDSEGREGYFIQCRECGTWLAGTIDPRDEVFLPL